MLKAVLFDFGGVIAEEGFREGLKAIGKKHGLDPDAFFRLAEELIYQTGYVVGMADEAVFLKALREKSGIKEADSDLREEVLGRFVVRHRMLEQADRLRASGLKVAILSDQTEWLDEIDKRTPFYGHFDRVFNSYKLKKGKRDPSLFGDVCSALGVRPEEALFIDDNIENIKRASAMGLKTIHFKDVKGFEKELTAFISNP